MNDLTNIPDRLRTLARDFLDEHPRAVGLRYEGTCDVCRRLYLISWQHTDLLDNENPLDGKEYCGFTCFNAPCGFSNPGARPVEGE